MYHILIIAYNQVGYQNMLKLSSDAWTKYRYYKPRVSWEQLEAHSEGLVCLSACLGGYPQQLLLEGRNEDAELSILRFKNIFGEHYYLEMQWTGIPEQETVNTFFKEMSAKHNIPLVITCDSHYTYKGESELHRALVTINTGGVYRKKAEKKEGELTDENKDTDEGSMFYTPGEYYLKPYHVLREHFNLDEDLVAFANTNKIAEMCSVKLPKDLKIFPQIVDDPEKYVMDRCNAFLEKHCKDMDDVERKVYYDRLEEESWVISRMEYFDYFVVVHDIIEYCKNNNILTGLGRGSASGCLISYCLGITGIDPLTYGLLFSRFLSSSRAKLPLIEFEGYPLLEHNYG
ncbi:PHP domain-containing protein [Candidatus Woesebacteria bacterium]|nr:PHP domain-containing protein [Candidatus Woesebacteria bacterium]